MHTPHGALPCRRLLSVALLAGGLLWLRAAAERRPGRHAIDTVLDASLRLVDRGDGFLTLS